MLAWGEAWATRLMSAFWPLPWALSMMYLGTELETGAASVQGKHRESSGSTRPPR